MSEKEEYVSLEKALKELRLKEDELKRLVSEGEIRAFRDADKMKFKREDIEKLKQDTGRTIQYTNESSDTLTDDLLFDEGGDDLDLGGDVGMATAPISSEETFVDEPKAKPAAKKPAPAPAKGKTASAPAAKPAAKTGSAEAKKSATSTGRTTSIRATTGGTGKAAVKRDPAEIHPALIGVSIFTTIVMLYACAMWWDIANGGRPSSVTEGFATSIHDSFLGKK